MKYIITYLIGVWLTFGYTLHFIGQPLNKDELRDWLLLDSVISALVWPIFWLFHSATLVFT